MTIGATLPSGALELVAREEPGLEPGRIVTTAATQIAAGYGRDVLVDVERHTALFVRGLVPPHAVDVERFASVLAAFERAGVGGLIQGSARVALSSVFQRVLEGPDRDPAPPRLPWDPCAYLRDLFLSRAMEQNEVFPDTWWHDDPAAGVDEMSDMLLAHGVKATFPRDRLVSDAVRELDRIEDEDRARDALCQTLCDEANRMLAAVNAERRFCGPYLSAFNGGEPNWLFTTPAQYDLLVAGGLLVPWAPAQRVVAEPQPYTRPPDRGEIDFSTFPSGDEPF